MTEEESGGMLIAVEVMGNQVKDLRECNAEQKHTINRQRSLLANKEDGLAAAQDKAQRLAKELEEMIERNQAMCNKVRDAEGLLRERGKDIDQLKARIEYMQQVKPLRSSEP